MYLCGVVTVVSFNEGGWEVLVDVNVGVVGVESSLLSSALLVL